MVRTGLSLIFAGWLTAGVPHALGHDENGWIKKRVDAAGVSCCHERDTVAIPHVHATEDRQGRAMVTRYGCLFKAFGG